MSNRRTLVATLLSLLLVTVVAAIAAAQGPEPGAPQARPVQCVNDCGCPAGSSCVAPGRCEPVFCPQIFDPVCGFDGRTYPNRCVAEAHHVKVLHDGPCQEVCGGIQGKRCPEGFVCDLPAGSCKGADLQGICRPRPEACPRDFRPVCGCDGKTYPNDCERLKAGAQKAHDGECRRDYGGCSGNGDCARPEYCAFPFGACDGRGRCEPRPEVCPFIFLPVCGCDGVTYSNSCFAAMAGVSVRSQGECP